MRRPRDLRGRVALFFASFGALVSDGDGRTVALFRGLHAIIAHVHNDDAGFQGEGDKAVEARSSHA